MGRRRKTKTQLPQPGSRRWLKTVIQAAFGFEHARDVADAIARLSPEQKDALLTKLIFLEPPQPVGSARLKSLRHRHQVWRDEVARTVVDHVNRACVGIHW